MCVVLVLYCRHCHYYSTLAAHVRCIIRERNEVMQQAE